MKFILLLLMPLTVLAQTNWQDWDGKYEDLNCGSAQECKTMGGQLNKQSRYKEAVPYMAKSCMLGEVGFCWLAADASKKFPKIRFALTKKGCELVGTIGNECREYIQVLLENGDLAQAKATYKSLCNDPSAFNCAPILGVGKMDKKSKVDLLEVKMIEESCKEGHTTACNILKLYPVK